jgi:RNA polymerase sigma-70 factor (ECF subfamily)
VPPQDRAPFEAACLPLLGDCFAFALSLTRNPHDAEDLVQDTFLKAQRAFASFEPGSNAKAWLFTILRRLHIDRYRRSKKRPVPLPEETLADLPEAAAPAEAEPDLPWDHLPPDALERAIEEVPEPFRVAVRLRDLEGFSYREIAEVLDIPPGTVMSRLFRGREWLRRALVSLADPPGEDDV